MKKCLFLIILLGVSSTVYAVLFSEFKSWDLLVAESPDIVIARCTTTPDFAPPGVTPKPTWTFGSATCSDVQVITVLKGNTKPGLSQLDSFFKPHQGEMFVVFGTFTTYQSNSWYNAIENYRVMPLDENFNLNSLRGKTLDEQIQITDQSAA